MQVTQTAPDLSPKLDLSIEGMQSQQFSEWIFVFLLISIFIFAGIVFAFLRSKDSSKEFRLGERLMFASIILGILLAIIFGAMQMLGGVLF